MELAQKKGDGPDFDGDFSGADLSDFDSDDVDAVLEEMDLALAQEEKKCPEKPTQE